MRVGIQAVHGFGVKVLEHHGVPTAAASNVLSVLLAAEARGFGSHGLLRLDRLVTGIQAGTNSPQKNPQIKTKGSCALYLDGENGLGPHLSINLMKSVMQKATTHGVCVGSAKNMTHFGFGGYYTDMAARQGLIGLVLCNTEPASSPFGGTGRVLGTNPISFSCPRRTGDPLTVDMATTAAARGKLLSAQLNKETIPDWIATDPDGNMTNDPDLGLKGALMPLGGQFGYKGSALGGMVDILSGALSGAAGTTRVQGTATTTVPCTAGFFFMALDPAMMTTRDEFLDEVESHVADIQAAGEAVLLPGQREHALERQANEQGLILKDEVRKMLQNMGDACKLEVPF